MNIIWDQLKAAENLIKHGVDFADAVGALQDWNALTIEDRDHREFRFKTLGMGFTGEILLVVHAESEGNCIRIISARRADPALRRQYWKGVSG